MKKNTLLLTLSLLLLSSPHALLAAGAYFTINGVGISDSSKTIYVTVKEVIDESPCESIKTFRMKTGPDSLYKDVLSVLLMAKISDLKVQINYSTDPTKCIYSAAMLTRVYLK